MLNIWVTLSIKVLSLLLVPHCPEAAILLMTTDWRNFNLSFCDLGAKPIMHSVFTKSLNHHSFHKKKDDYFFYDFCWFSNVEKYIITYLF